MSASAEVWKIEFDLVLDPQLMCIPNIEPVKEVSAAKDVVREEILDKKCLDWNKIKENFYGVEFEKNLANELLEKVRDSCLLCGWL